MLDEDDAWEAKEMEKEEWEGKKGKKLNFEDFESDEDPGSGEENDEK